MSRVLVTGGSGFIGTNLVEHLVARGHTVCNLDLEAPRNPGQRPLWRRQDVREAESLTRAVSEFEPQYVFHLAARTDVFGRTVDDYASNTAGVTGIVAATRACRSIRRVVFASSRLVCRIGYQPRDEHDYQPSTAYGASKAEGERIVRAARELPYEWAIVRPTSIWGPWFAVPYRNFFDAIRAGRYLHPRGRRVHKSFGYVGNTVVQLERLLQAPAGDIHQRMFYLADYQPIEVRGWGEMIRGAFAAPPIRDVPLPMMRAAARVGDLLSNAGWKQVPLTSFRLDNLLTEMVHDVAPLAAVCGGEQIDTERGVRATAAWMRRH